MASTRQRILAALATRLEEIRTVNGFNTEAGQAVYLGAVAELGENDPQSVIALVVASEDVTAFQGAKVISRLVVEAQAIASTEIAEPYVLIEQLIEDIKRAIELEDRTLGGLTGGSHLARAGVRSFEREAGSAFVGAAVIYAVPLPEAWGAP